jgi:hypothetical protein
VDIAQLLMEKLLKQGYIAIKLKSLLQKCYGHHQNVLRNIHIANIKVSVVTFTSSSFG